MKTKLKLVVSLACLSVICLGAASCKDPTKDQEMAEKGYVISVTYDPNGGKFMNRDGITIKDYFNPNFYQTETDGSVQISLLEPTDPSRPTSSLDKITLSRPNYSWVGWYQERNVVTNGSGEVVDVDGNVLELKEDGSYVYAANGKEATPAYSYSGRWDFQTEKLTYKAEDYADSDGMMSLTLYAGWVPYYEFHYYYQTDNGWEMEGTTSFDYVKAQTNNSGLDYLWLPQWSDGAMNYTHSQTSYTFPRKKDTTFLKAYTDEDCTQEITTDSFKHTGTLDVATGAASNRIQNIYVVADEGEQYRITNAQQLINNVNVNGYYEIQRDLDFTDLRWPAGFSIGRFTGKFYGANQTSYKISNVNVSVNNEGAQYGGLFGFIDASAEIKDVNFENATVDLMKANGKSNETAFGLFAGYIEDEALISNVKVSGTLKIGGISLANGWSINLLANGNNDGINEGVANAVKLQAYGADRTSYYYYTFNFNKINEITIDSETYAVTGIEFKTTRDQNVASGTLVFNLN